MYDARAIANLILDYAEDRGIDCSHLKLQKLLYFVHGNWLVRHNKPLCKGEFEAWTHGPVHPLVYQAFRQAGSEKIIFRATAIDPVLRTRKALVAPRDVLITDVVHSVVSQLGHLSGSQLRNLTHSKGGPWHITVDKSEQNVNIGMKISNDVIRSSFGKQIYLVGGGPEESELDEDSPNTRD